MKKYMLLLGALLFFAACTKDLEPSRDYALDGEEVNVTALKGICRKLFVLNEGGMGSNNASLDFLHFSDGKYIKNAFGKMNPDVASGLGDVGNDIAVNGDEVWVVVNNSGIVEVLSAKDETEIAAIAVPTPRNIAFDNKYAYVTSWAGAYVNYDSGYNVTDFKNPKGQVYRIDLTTRQIAGSVEVGYQPEGIACYDGRLYVANSGGISSQLPPSYSYDNTVSIIDIASFKLIKNVEVAVNLKSIYSDGHGAIYVSSFGNYYDVHSGMYVLYARNPEKSMRLGEGSAVKPEALNVTCSAMAGNTVYCIGTENEFDWSAPRSYSLWSFRVEDYESGKGHFTLYPDPVPGTPYGLAVLEKPSSSGADEPHPYFIIGDAGDYFNPGTVSCYDWSAGGKLWEVTAGVCPGHFAIW